MDMTIKTSICSGIIWKATIGLTMFDVSSHSSHCIWLKTRHYDVAVHLPVRQKAKGNTNIWQK